MRKRVAFSAVCLVGVIYACKEPMQVRLIVDSDMGCAPADGKPGFQEVSLYVGASEAEVRAKMAGSALPATLQCTDWQSVNDLWVGPPEGKREGNVFVVATAKLVGAKSRAPERCLFNSATSFEPTPGCLAAVRRFEFPKDPGYQVRISLDSGCADRDDPCLPDQVCVQGVCTKPDIAPAPSEPTPPPGSNSSGGDPTTDSGMTSSGGSSGVMSSGGSSSSSGGSSSSSGSPPRDAGVIFPKLDGGIFKKDGGLIEPVPGPEPVTL